MAWHMLQATPMSAAAAQETVNPQAPHRHLLLQLMLQFTSSSAHPAATICTANDSKRHKGIHATQAHTCGRCAHQLTSSVARKLLLQLSNTPCASRPSNRQ
jgi:hypothetical protein